MKDKILEFTYNQKDENLFNQFLTVLNGCLKNFIRPYRRKLFLKGLGFNYIELLDKSFFQEIRRNIQRIFFVLLYTSFLAD